MGKCLDSTKLLLILYHTLTYTRLWSGLALCGCKRKLRGSFAATI